MRVSLLHIQVTRMLFFSAFVSKIIVGKVPDLMTHEETALAWLAYFYLITRMITVGSFLMPIEEAAQAILPGWPELKW